MMNLVTLFNRVVMQAMVASSLKSFLTSSLVSLVVVNDRDRSFFSYLFKIIYAIKTTITNIKIKEKRVLLNKLFSLKDKV